jgi:hypothetical protein
MNAQDFHTSRCVSRAILKYNAAFFAVLAIFVLTPANIVSHHGILVSQSRSIISTSTTES